MSPALRPHHALALATVASRLDHVGAEWLLAGSTARRLDGWDVSPRDIDIEVAARTAHAAAEALGLSLREDDSDGTRSLRALGEVAGTGVDLTSELHIRGPGGSLPSDFTIQRMWATPVEVAGRRMWLAPVEESIARAIVRGEWSALARIASGAAEGHALRAAYLSLRLAAAARAAR